MATKYGVFVVTPPPSETVMVAAGRTPEEARSLALTWADGQIQWTTQTEGITYYGEKVLIEEIRTPLRRGEPLGYVTWDEIFETSVFEKYLATELGLHLSKYEEVTTEDRDRWNEVWHEAAGWIMAALKARGIEPYSLQGSEIYPVDVKGMILELRRETPLPGPKDWDPTHRRWERALGRAFGRLLGVKP